MKIKTVKDLIAALENVGDKNLPVMLDDFGGGVWPCIKDISITTNSYGNHVVIINQEK